MTRRRSNPDQVEMAEYAIRRWNHLAPWQERGLTWSVFADRIRQTHDPGSQETANAIESLPGAVSDWALPAEVVTSKSSSKYRRLLNGRNYLR